MLAVASEVEVSEEVVSEAEVSEEVELAEVELAKCLATSAPWNHLRHTKPVPARPVM